MKDVYKRQEYIQFVQAREKLEADNEQSTILNELLSLIHICR